MNNLSDERLDRFSNIMNDNLLSDEELSNSLTEQKIQKEEAERTLKEKQQQAIVEQETKKQEDQSWIGLDVVTAPLAAFVETSGKVVTSAGSGIGYLGYTGAEIASNAVIGVNNLISSHKKNYVDYSKNYNEFEKNLLEREKVISESTEQFQEWVATDVLGNKSQSKIGDAINSRATAEIASTVLEYANVTGIAKKGITKTAKALGKEAPNLDTIKAGAAVGTGAVVLKQAIYTDQENTANAVLKGLDKESREGIIGAIATSLAINETDTAFEKRLKNTIVELPLGILGEVAMPIFKAFRNAKKADYSNVKNISGEQVETAIKQEISKIDEIPLPNDKNVLLKSVQQNLKISGIDKSLDDLAKIADENNLTILQSNGDVTPDLIDDFTKIYSDIYGNPKATIVNKEIDTTVALTEEERIALDVAETAAKNAEEEFNAAKQSFDIAEESNFISKNLDTNFKSNKAEITRDVTEVLDTLKSKLSTVKVGKNFVINESINQVVNYAKNFGVELDPNTVKETIKNIKEGDTKQITESLISNFDDAIKSYTETQLRSSFKNQAGFASTELIKNMAAGSAGGITGIVTADENATTQERLMRGAVGFVGGIAGLKSASIAAKYIGKSQDEIIDSVQDIKNKLLTRPDLINKISGVIKGQQNLAKVSENIKAVKEAAKDSKLAKTLESPKYSEMTQNIVKALDNAYDNVAFNELKGENFKQTYAILDNASAESFDKDFANFVFGEKFNKMYQSNDATVALADLKDKKKAYGIEDVSTLMTTPIGKLPEELVRAKRFITQLTVKVKESSIELNKINKALNNYAKTGDLNYNGMTYKEASDLRDTFRLQQKKDFEMLSYSADMMGKASGQAGRSLQILNRSVDVGVGGSLQRKQIKELTSDLNVNNIDNLAQAIAESADENLLNVLNIARVGKFDRIADAVMYVRLSGLLSSGKSLVVNTVGGVGQIGKETAVDYVAATTGYTNRLIRSAVNSAFGTRLKISDDIITFGEANIKARAKLEATWDFFSGVVPFIKNAKKEGIGNARDILAHKVAGHDAVKVYANEGIVQDATTGAMNTINPLKNFLISPRNDTEKVLQKVLYTIGDAVGVPLEVMKATDQLIYGVQFRSEIYGLAYKQAHKELKAGTLLKENIEGRIAQLKANPTDEMIERAYNESKKVTFQQDLARTTLEGQSASGVVGDVAIAVNTLRERSPVIGKLIVPFVKTPTNITIETLESTPLAFVPGLTRSKEEWVRIMKEGGEEADRLVAKAIIGTSLIGLGMQLYSDGILSADDGYGKGLFSTTEEEKAQGITSKRKTGVKGYSVKIGNNYYSVGRESVIGTYLQIGSQYQYALDKGLSTKEYDAAVIGALMAGGKVLGDKTFVQGFVELNKAMSDSSRNDNGAMERYFSNQLSSFVPLGGLQRDINNIIDPELKELHELFDRTKAKTLTMKDGLYNKRDVITGEVLVNQDASMWNPFEKSSESSSGLVNELDRIGYVVKSTPKNIYGVKLTGKEYDDLQKYITQDVKIYDKNLKEHLLEVVNSEEYQNALDGEVYNYDGSNTKVQSQEDIRPVKGTKQYMIDAVFKAYKAEGINKFMKENPKGKEIFINKNIHKYLGAEGNDYKAAKIHAENDFLEMVQQNQ